MPPYGQGEHPGLAVGCHAAPGDLCDDRPADARAVLRRMGLRRAGRQQPPSRPDRLYQGRADGRRVACAPQGKSPTFLVAALKDLGANLDRYQIVKGWLTKGGKLEEKVYDVAWADAERRKPGRTASCHRSAIPSMKRTPPGRTRSARQSWRRSGPTRTSTQASRPSITAA